MTGIDDIAKSIKVLYQRLAVGGRRTATITRLRMELSGLDRQRREIFIQLGERVDELRRSDQITDRGLLRLLEPEFENIDRLRKKIQDTMDTIQSLNLEETCVDEITEEELPEGIAKRGSENLLDSFDVL